MYTKDGEKYFIVDSHMHFWDATPANWVPGAEQYAKGWIECFHAYQSLGPPETHWPIEKFEGYTEDDLMRDVFEDGHVDIAIFQPTYLKEWYPDGLQHDRAERGPGGEAPGQVHRQHPVRPPRRRRRPGRAATQRRAVRVEGREAVHGRVEQRLARLQAERPGRLPVPGGGPGLGIKNVHVHKGPTIWPLDKDAFDVSDVDHAATDFPDLNFIVEHVGLPRIEDFCFMATQEPNVYAGLSVVIGGLMHARPKFFAKVMGELLFWVGEDKMTFGSDYGIWEPKWQVEGFVDWQMPDDDELSDYAKLTTATKKKILGLNAAKLYDIPVPAEFLVPAQAGEPAAQDDAAAGHRGMSSATDAPASVGIRTVDGLAGAVLAALATVRDPELDEPVTTLGFVASCTVSRGRAGAGPAAAADLLLRAQLRLPHGGRRLRRGHARCRACRRAEVILDDHFASDAINAGVAARAGFAASFDGEAIDELDNLRATFLRKAVLAGTDLVCRPLVAAGRTPAELAALTLGDVPASPRADPAAAAPRRPRPACRGRRPTAASTQPPASASRRGERAAPPAPGAGHPDRHRGQHLASAPACSAPLPAPAAPG